MANTTNYNWETPDDTDLVKDGAAAIRTLGSSVDTTTKALNPSTTLGDIEYRSATANTNTRLGIGSTGQVLTVAGGVPTWATSDDANAIQNAIVDAKGDIVAASAADTPARLAVGTDNQRLVAASGEATGLKYVSDTQNTVIDAAGDLVYGTAADTLTKLAIGTAGQVLQVNSGATAPEWATPAAATGSTVAVFSDNKTAGTGGGTFTSGAWRTRDLQTSLFNNITSCSLASNQITLPAGTYEVSANAPSFQVNASMVRLYNITDSAVVGNNGSTCYNAASDSTIAPAILNLGFTITGTKVFELQHRCETTKSSNGYGVDVTFGGVEVYSQIKIVKVA